MKPFKFNERRIDTVEDLNEVIVDLTVDSLMENIYERYPLASEADIKEAFEGYKNDMSYLKSELEQEIATEEDKKNVSRSVKYN
ncbi:MAG TPA: hypothetical protein PLU30_27460 [Verrucomicrobiae bacterium]|nr:hypothetical protein [Verrucomicrobiae bacterium]